MELIVSCNPFKKLAYCLKDVGESFIMEITDDGIEIFTTNEDTSLLLSAFIPKENFKTFNKKEQMEMDCLCIETSFFVDQIKNIPGSSLMKIRVEKDGDVVIAFKINKYETCKLILNTEKNKGDPWEVPQFEYGCHFSLPTESFHSLCQSFEKIDGEVRIMANRKHVNFSASSQNVTIERVFKSAFTMESLSEKIENIAIEDNKKRKYAQESVYPQIIKCDEEVNNSFEMKFLKIISKLSPVSPKIDFHYGTDIPMKIGISFCDWKVNYFLCPIVECVSEPGEE